MVNKPRRPLFDFQITVLLLGLSSALCYAAAWTRFPLLAIYAQPIQNLLKLTNGNAWSGLVIAIALVVLFVGYALGAGLLAQSARETTPTRGLTRIGKIALLGFPLVFVVILLFVFPVTSTDLYDYIFRGRMLARYEANTFINVPIDFKSDPLFWYVAWRRAVTAYGPVWEGMSWVVAHLAGERVGTPGQNAARDAELLRLLLAYKGLATLGYLLCGGAIWAMLRRNAPAWRWVGVYLWLWNPLALWESIGAGHNDAWMVALIVLAVGLMTPTYSDTQVDTTAIALPLRLSSGIGAFLALTVGGLIKYFSLMFGPLLLASALRRLPTWRSRLGLIVGGGLACLALIVVAYAPFWVGTGTLRNFSDRGTLFTNSWLALIQAPITLSSVKALIPAPRLLALILAENQVQPFAVSIGLGLLAFGALWSAWRAWRTPNHVAYHALWLVLWFLFLCNPWFQPWYLLWALALVALQPWRSHIARVVIVFCCTGMLSYLASVYLLPVLGWNVDGAEWNGLASLLIYLPPLIVLLWPLRARAPRIQQPAQALPAAPAEEI